MKNSLYVFIVSLFCVVFVLSIIISSKLFYVPFVENFYLPVGMITFPLTFFLGNLITEIYGKKEAKQMIYVGFVVGLISHLVLKLAVALPSPDFKMYEAFKTVFDLSGLTMYSSLLAYIISQSIEINLYAYLKKLTLDKHLWLRNNGSTLVTQFIDTSIANWLLVYVGMQMDARQSITIVLSCYTYKCILTLLATPIFYAAVYFIKRLLNKYENTYNPAIA